MDAREYAQSDEGEENARLYEDAAGEEVEVEVERDFDDVEEEVGGSGGGDKGCVAETLGEKVHDHDDAAHVSEG